MICKVPQLLTDPEEGCLMIVLGAIHLPLKFCDACDEALEAGGRIESPGSFYPSTYTGFAM